MPTSFRSRLSPRRLPPGVSSSRGGTVGPRQLDGLARYEVHLDRKLERMLAMLLKPKELGRSVELT